MGSEMCIRDRFGDALVECEVGDVRSGYATMGHRFHHPGEITIGSAADYQDKLRACHVIVDHEERQNLIREQAKGAAAAAGLTLVEDEGLVVENAGLTEWPVPLLGRIDEAFLEVPPEVIQLTARTNQKYFVCEKDGRLANAFVCTANIVASDGGEAIVAGNRKVLAARLSDARFFWEQDRKKTLSEHRKGLERITFHEKLGTVADKVERVAKLARWLVEQGIVNPPRNGEGDRAQRGGGGSPPDAAPAVSPLHHPADGPPPRAGEDLANMAEQAARLCKADLVTEMVGEFPELQGLMGGYYARAEGLPDAVADAIRDHYKPVGQVDDVPTAPVTVAVSLADKLDNLFSFFEIDLLPTGSKDPFALRRAGLGYLQLSQKNDLKLLVEQAAEAWGGRGVLGRRVADFLFDRLGVQLKDQGVRHDFIQASRAWGLGNDTDSRVDRVELRARMLAQFLNTEDGANLFAGYKRAANILKKERVVPAEAGTGGGIDANSRQDGQRSRGEPGTTIPRDAEEDPFAMVDDPDVAFAMRERLAAQNALSYTPEPAENALIEALALAGPQAAAAVEKEDFTQAMAALASLRAPIDAFFDTVTVNDADPVKRASRLSLLDQFRAAVHNVADFSKIEG